MEIPLKLYPMNVNHSVCCFLLSCKKFFSYFNWYFTVKLLVIFASESFVNFVF